MSCGRRLRRAATLTGVLVATLCVACSSPADNGPAGRPDPGDEAPHGTLTVFAAASLTDAFDRLADGFEDAHPGVEVLLSFGSSSALAQQVLAGAPADLLATASPEALAPVTDAGANRGQPVVFTRNAIALAVPAGNPGGVTGLRDLADPDLAVALCEPQVPCGAAAQRALTAAGATARPDTLERDVRAVLTKLRMGEVDAGIVYRTEVVAASGDLEEVDLPPAARVSTHYPVVLLSGAPNPAAARAFVDHLVSAQGQEVLAGAGFDAP